MNGELEGRWSWLIPVYNHSACLGTPKTIKYSRFESKPVLLTYTWTRTYLLLSRYIVCASTANHCPVLTVRHHCTTHEFRIWSFAFKETILVSYRRIQWMIMRENRGWVSIQLKVQSPIPDVVLLLPGFWNSKETGRTALIVICNGLNFAKANKISQFWK